MACQGGGGNLVYVVILCRIPADALLQVEHQLRLLCICTEGIALESGTLGGCKLNPHVRLLQFHGVVARAHILVGMTEEDFLLAGIGYGQESHVAQVADTGAAEVLMAESDEYGVGMVIAGAPVPAT